MITIERLAKVAVEDLDMPIKDIIYFSKVSEDMEPEEDYPCYEEEKEECREPEINNETSEEDMDEDFIFHSDDFFSSANYEDDYEDEDHGRESHEYHEHKETGAAGSSDTYEDDTIASYTDAEAEYVYEGAGESCEGEAGTSYTEDISTPYEGDIRGSEPDGVYASYEEDTDASYEKDADASYVEDTGVSYEGNTDTSYGENIEASYREDTVVSYEGNVCTSYIENIEASYRDNTEALYDTDTNALYEENADESFRDDPLYAEKEAIKKERSELEALYAKFEQEKKQFFLDMKKLNKKTDDERKKLKDEEIFFDKKMNILKGGFAQLEADRCALEREKRAWERERLETAKRRDMAYRDESMRIFFAGVSSPLTLKKRYRDLIKIFHPDNVGGDNGILQRINRIYDNMWNEMGWQKKA